MTSSPVRANVEKKKKAVRYWFYCYFYLDGIQLNNNCFNVCWCCNCCWWQWQGERQQRRDTMGHLMFFTRVHIYSTHLHTHTAKYFLQNIYSQTIAKPFFRQISHEQKVFGMVDNNARNGNCSYCSEMQTQTQRRTNENFIKMG